MKSIKRVIIMLMVCMFIFTFLAACTQTKPSESTTTGTERETTQKPAETKDETTKPEIENFNPTGYPIVDEKITLTMMGFTVPALHEDWSEILFFQRMEEMTNMSFNFITVPLESYQERKNLAFASGDLPDLFFKGRLTNQDQMTYGAESLLIPLEDLIEDYAPNLKRVFEYRPDLRQAVTLPSGHIVALRFVEPPRTDPMFWINKVWMDHLGIQEPTTTEEFYGVLKAFRDNDANQSGDPNDEIPMSIQGAWGVKRFLGNFGLLFNEANIFVNNNDEVIFSPMQPEFKEGIKYLRVLFEEQLMDNESFTQSGQQINAKGQNNLLGVFISLSPQGQSGSYHTDYVSLIPLVTNKGEQMYDGMDGIDAWGGFAITHKNQHPEATIRWIDYLYSEEGGILEQYGLEGEDWEWQSDGTWDHIFKEGETLQDKNRRVAIHAGGNVPHLRPQEFINQSSNSYDHWLFPQWDRVSAHARRPYPRVYFEDDQQKSINVLNADIASYVDEMIARFITGDSSIENEWDSYLATLRQMGVEELIQIYTDKFNELN